MVDDGDGGTIEGRCRAEDEDRKKESEEMKRFANWKQIEVGVDQWNDVKIGASPQPDVSEEQWAGAMQHKL